MLAVSKTGENIVRLSPLINNYFHSTRLFCQLLGPVFNVETYSERLFGVFNIPFLLYC